MKKYVALEQLQNVALDHQGLTTCSPFGTGKDAVLKTVEHLGYIQIDTLSVVERAHHHTLWTRVPDYRTQYLEELVEERELFEYWFHAASYLPMKDFRYALPQMLSVTQNTSHHYNADPKMMKYVLDTIRIDGPKKVKDFEHKSGDRKGWWNYKPMKIALERLFLQGDLLIAGRNGMHKIYDIRERVLPAHIDMTTPSTLELATYLVETHLRAYGVTTLKQILHLRTGTLLKKNVEEVLHTMVLAGQIQQIDINGAHLFIQDHVLEKDYSKRPMNTHILSPFDNSIIHRERTKHLFNFDFRLECYLPKEKRLFGYFCLPIVFGNSFIGRIDCKAHRSSKELEIIRLHIENGHININVWLTSFVQTMQRFMLFNGCESLVLTNVSPSRLTNTIKQELSTLFVP